MYVSYDKLAIHIGLHGLLGHYHARQAIEPTKTYVPQDCLIKKDFVFYLFIKLRIFKT